MRLSEFREDLLTETFPVGSGGFSLTWDRNRLNGTLKRRMAALYRERSAEVEGAEKVAPSDETSVLAITERLAHTLEVGAVVEDLEKEIYSEVLACDRGAVLKSWGLEGESEGEESLPTFENLMSLPAQAVRDIYVFVREHSGYPKKTETPSSLTTDETTSDTSSSPTCPLPENQIM